MEQKTVTKVSLTTFNPARFSALQGVTGAPNAVVLGYLVGRAIGTVERKNPKDEEEVFTGLKGDFECRLVKVGEIKDGKYVEALNEDGTPQYQDVVRSGVLFMPDAFQGPIEAMLSDKVDGSTGEVTQPGAPMVDFLYKVEAVAANNPQKRSWQLTAINDPTIPAAADPLAEMQKLLPGAVVTTPQLAPPSGDTGGEPQPVSEAAVSETEKAKAATGKRK